MTATRDKEDYEELAAGLRELTIEATFAVTADVHNLAAGTKAAVDSLVTRMQAHTSYVVRIVTCSVQFVLDPSARHDGAACTGSRSRPATYPALTAVTFCCLRA